jgi:hypothetical protein
MSIAVLPLDCLKHIFTFLEAADLIKRVNLVCRQWRDFSNKDLLWQALCLKDFSRNDRLDDRLSWKALYRIDLEHKRELREVRSRMLVAALEELETGKFECKFGC